MVYNFETHEISQGLTLHAIHTYIWSRTLESVRHLFSEITVEDTHKELLRWIDSLDLDQRLDNLRACLLVFSITDGQVIPRQFQLEAGLAVYYGKNTIVNSGTGSGKTLSMAIPLLMNPEAVGIIISPLKRLQSTQGREFERFMLKPLVINQDVVLSSNNIKVFPIEIYSCYSR